MVNSRGWTATGGGTIMHWEHRGRKWSPQMEGVEARRTNHPAPSDTTRCCSAISFSAPPPPLSSCPEGSGRYRQAFKIWLYGTASSDSKSGCVRLQCPVTGHDTDRDALSRDSCEWLITLMCILTASVRCTLWSSGMPISSQMSLRRHRALFRHATDSAACSSLTTHTPVNSVIALLFKVN